LKADHDVEALRWVHALEKSIEWYRFQGDSTNEYPKDVCTGAETAEPTWGQNRDLVPHPGDAEDERMTFTGEAEEVGSQSDDTWEKLLYADGTASLRTHHHDFEQEGTPVVVAPQLSHLPNQSPDNLPPASTTIWDESDNEEMAAHNGFSD
jgi:hypothetical protein